MALREALNAVPKAQRKATGCGWARWLSTLDEADRKAAVDAMMDPSWGTTNLARELRKAGAPERVDRLLGRHRRRECAECL